MVDVSRAFKAEHGSSLSVTAPAEENVYAETEGAISVILISASGQSLLAEQKVAVAAPEIKLQIQWTQGDQFFTELRFGSADEAGATELKPANTFLVRPGQLYRFKANVMGRGAEGVSAMGLSGDVNTIGGFDIRSDASVNSLLTGEYEYIYFNTYAEGSTAQAGGTGVVSVTINGEAAWSWLVWARDVDPALEDMGDGYEQMEVNLGSWGPKTIKKRLGHTTFNMPFGPYYGLYYSWGFPVPYPGLTTYDLAIMPNNIYFAPSDLYHIYYYDETGNPVETSKRFGTPTENLADAVANPRMMADLVSDGTDEYAQMWGAASDEKTIFDPCPYGYRVATEELFALYSFGMPQTGGQQYQIPSGEYKILYYGGYLGVENDIPAIKLEDYTSFDGYYWTNGVEPVSVPEYGTPSYGGDNAVMFYADGHNYGATTMPRYTGALVRCIKYDKEM